MTLNGTIYGRDGWSRSLPGAYQHEQERTDDGEGKYDS
jgi:hypothetical protein